MYGRNPQHRRRYPGRRIAKPGISLWPRGNPPHDRSATVSLFTYGRWLQCGLLLAEGDLARRPVGRDARPHLGSAGADGGLTAPCTQSAAAKTPRKTGAVSRKSRGLVSISTSTHAGSCTGISPTTPSRKEDEHLQRLKGGRHHEEEVAGEYRAGMIMEERRPTFEPFGHHGGGPVTACSVAPCAATPSNQASGGASSRSAPPPMCSCQWLFRDESLHFNRNAGSPTLT